MNESIPTIIKNNLKHSQKQIRTLGQDGKEIERIDYGKSKQYPAGTYYKFTTDGENDLPATYCEINTGGDITFSKQGLAEWKKVKVKLKKIKNTNDETVNVTIGEDRPDT